MRSGSPPDTESVGVFILDFSASSTASLISLTHMVFCYSNTEQTKAGRKRQTSKVSSEHPTLLVIWHILLGLQPDERLLFCTNLTAHDCAEGPWGVGGQRQSHVDPDETHVIQGADDR